MSSGLDTPDRTPVSNPLRVHLFRQSRVHKSNFFHLTENNFFGKIIEKFDPDKIPPDWDMAINHGVICNTLQIYHKKTSLQLASRPQ